MDIAFGKRDARQRAIRADQVIGKTATLDHVEPVGEHCARRGDFAAFEQRARHERREHARQCAASSFLLGLAQGFAKRFLRHARMTFQQQRQPANGTPQAGRETLRARIAERRLLGHKRARLCAFSGVQRQHRAKVEVGNAEQRRQLREIQLIPTRDERRDLAEAIGLRQAATGNAQCRGHGGLRRCRIVEHFLRDRDGLVVAVAEAEDRTDHQAQLHVAFPHLARQRSIHSRASGKRPPVLSAQSERAANFSAIASSPEASACFAASG